jgi:hypothetical protein
LSLPGKEVSWNKNCAYGDGWIQIMQRGGKSNQTKRRKKGGYSPRAWPDPESNGDLSLVSRSSAPNRRGCAPQPPSLILNTCGSEEVRIISVQRCCWTHQEWH